MPLPDMGKTPRKCRWCGQEKCPNTNTCRNDNCPSNCRTFVTASLDSPLYYADMCAKCGQFKKEHEENT